MATGDKAGPSLGETAQAGLHAVSNEDGSIATDTSAPMFKGMDFTKVAFLGMNYNTLDKDYKIGDEVSFLVTGTVGAVGDEAMADGHIRHMVKVKVRGINPPGEAPAE
jgi:hypothetical protein